MRDRAVVYAQIAAVWAIVAARIAEQLTQARWIYVIYIASGLLTLWCGLNRDGYQSSLIRGLLVIGGAGLAVIGVWFLIG